VVPNLPRLDVSVDTTDVCLAFKLRTDLLQAPEQQATGSLPHQRPAQQPVFAFLPLRSYGLRFVVQVCSSPGPLVCHSAEAGYA
jgi:hypothetical protein